MKVKANMKLRIFSILVFTAVFLFFYLYQEVDYQWLLGSKPYSEMDDVSYISAIKRLFIYLLSIITTFSFFLLVPRKKYFFTKVGKYTLYVYLLHGFFVRTFRESELKDILPEFQAILLIAIGSLLLTFLLTNKIVISIVQPFVEMQFSRLKQLFSSIKREEYKYER